MSFPAYPSYKDSGVEWLGQIPDHWSIGPLKRKYQVTLGKMLQPEAADNEDQLMPYLRAANIQWDGVDTSDIKQMWFSLRDMRQLSLSKGDLLVSEGGDVGRSSIWNDEVSNCFFQNSVNRVRAVDSASTRFLYYWIQAIKEQGYIDVICNKSTIAHFTAEKVAAVPVPFPTPSEQNAIATFLDHETAKIDELIQEQERLIDLLLERQSVFVSKLVTQGLNGGVNLVNSGVSWLGPVPSHWKVLPIKRIVESPVTDGPHETPEFVDSGIPFVSAEAVSSGVIDFEKIRGFITESEHLRYSQKYKPRRDDIFIVKSGATTGVSAIVETDTDFNIWSPLAVIRCGPAVLPRFALHFIRSKNFKEAVQLGWSFGTQQNIGMGVIENLSITIPPIEEQEAIVKALDEFGNQVNELIRESREGIKLLSERKNSLISAAVTGKIDVRGFVAPAIQ